MKSIWHWLKDYFDLSYGERRGIMLLLVLIFMLIILRYSLPYIIPTESAEYDFSEIKQFAKALEEKQKTEGSESFNANEYSLTELEKEASASAMLFPFDPNTASLDDFQKLGLSPKLSKTIINYRNKGGKFYIKEDLQKIYGLKPAQYQKLEPYIDLPSKTQKNKSEYENPGNFAKEKTERTALVLEINSADSVDLVKLHGIGPAFASRIVKYRNLLGGFLRKEQLLEVYGLDSLKYTEIENQLKVNPALARKININTASVEELRKHPYLKYKLANAIFQFRQRNGNFKSVEDLKKIYLIDQKTLRSLGRM